MMKKLIALLSTLLLLVTLATACNTVKTEEPLSVRIATIQGPTGIGMVHLMKAADNKETELNYAFSTYSTPDDARAQILNETADIAALPTNVAANLYTKTNGKIKLLAVNTLGVLYMLENGNTIQSIQDLKGKTIYSTGQGANPEYVLNYILKQNGLDPATDVTINFVSENTELATLMVSGQATIAMVPQPVVSTITTKNANVRIALSMNDEWEAVAGKENKLMMGCVAVRTDFLENHPKEVETFLKEYKSSIEKTSDVDATAQLCEEKGIIPQAAIAKKAIPYCELTFVSGQTMKNQIAKYYSVLFEAKPQSIGGALPDDAFYYVG